MANKKKKKSYGPKQFPTFKAAYGAYQKDRFKLSTNPTIIPAQKFKVIWGWTKKEK